MAVTPESNLALIEELQELVGASTYEPVDGPEFSYPAVGQAVDDEMWKFITLAQGNGVLDMGDGSYWLKSFNNADNTVVLEPGRLGLGHAVVGGFYHRLQKSMTLSIPMPTSETTYYVALELNPLKAKTPEGPISIQVYPNELNTESGRTHLILWEITRKPNQLLTDATVTKIRPRVSPVIYVHEKSQLPDVKTVLWGSIAVVGKNAELFRALPRDEDDPSPNVGDGKWESLSGPPFSDPGDTAAYKWVGHGYRRGYRRVGDTLEFRGRIARTNGAKFVNGGGDNILGYQLYNMSVKEDWPEQEQRFITASSSLTGQRLCVITVTRDGYVYGMPVLGDADWIGLDGVRVAIRE